MLKIAITGASGFIGRHVLRQVAQHDVSVVACTNATPVPSKSPENVRWIQHDMADENVDHFKILGEPDILIHLAWRGLPNYTSMHHFESELPLQYQFLKSLVVHGLKSMLVTGTCFEYGLRNGSLAEHLLSQPNNPYGFAKDALRKQLDYLTMHIPFNFTWARFFYVYGEGQSRHSIFSQLKTAVSEGKPQFNMSGGEQVRDYLPVSIAASHLVTLALQNQGYGIVNICSGSPRFLKDIVEEWIRENEWKINVNRGYYPYPDYEPMAFWGNARKLDFILNAQSGMAHTII